MIKRILSRPVTIVMCAAAVIIIGLIALGNLPIELMPSTDTGEISVIYEIRGGIPPDRIEEFVIKPVEDVLGDIDNLDDILSIAKDGRAVVVLQFASGADMDAAVISTRERLAQVRDRLPREVERPIVAQYQQDDLPVFIIGVTSHTKDAEEIREIVDEVIAKRISRIEGVANADVFGGRERKIIIEVMPVSLRAFNLSMADVINALNRANVSTVAGEAEERESEYQITATGRFKDIDDIAGMGVSVDDRGSIVRLSDIARIKDSYLEPDSLSRLNMQSNVSIYVQKETLARTVKVAGLILEEIDSLKDTLPDDVVINVVKNDAEYIQVALDSMKLALVVGAFLAAGVLVFFLKNYLLIFIIFLSIPVSVLLAISLLYFNNVTLNVMTMGGLALGVGMLLDNSIVVIENMSRVYKNTENIKDAVSKAVSEVVIPIVAGTITTVIVFLPIVFLSDALQKLQGDMALAIMYSLLASLFASLTLVPFLYLNLGARKAPSGGGRDKQGGIYALYRKVIGRLFKYKVYIIAIMIVLFVSAVIAFRTIDMNLFETQDENKFTVHVELPTGARLGASDEVVNMVEGILEDMPEVETLSTRIEKWSSRIHVTLKDVEKREKSKEEIKSYLRPQFENIDAFIYFQEPNEMAEQEVFIEIFGYNYDKLRELATEVGQRMRGVEGMEDVKLRMREGRPEKVVVPDRRKLALTGLSISDLAQNLHSRIRGLVATRFHEHAREIEVIVRQHKPTISEFEQFFATELMSPAKVFVRLNQFADFIDAEAPSEIWRKNRQRMVQVSGTRNDISLEKAVRDIELNLEPMDFPENYFYDIGGDYDFMMESRDELFTALALTVLLVYLVLGAVFESYTQPFIIMVAVPMSFIGVVAALLITKSMVSMGVIMGVIMLAGIVVNNSIMLIDRINSLKADMPLKAAVIEGASQRLRPILMTTITTILGLLPLALKGGEGSGLWQPLSIAVIGGMMTSTFLVLIAIPCIYILIEDAGVKAKEISKYL